MSSVNQTVPLDRPSRPVGEAPAPRQPGRQPGGQRGRWRAAWGSQRRTGDWIGWLFLVPVLLVFAYFAWWPILRGLVLAVQQTNLVQPARYVGLENFQRLFADPLLPTAVRNTAWFALLSLVLGFPVPLVLSVLMNEIRRAAAVFRVLVYLPAVVPPVVSVLLWKWFYQPDTGLFNQVLGLVGLGPVRWLDSPSTAMVSIVLEAIWAGAGATVLIYLAALSSVPEELYEAAELDGASIPRRAWHVTLPQLRGVILIILLLQMLGAFQLFAEPFVFTGGGPDNSTTTVLLLVFQYAFVDGDYGGAAALSVLLAAALAILSAVYLRVTRGWTSS
ncbi:sugar ABC transporter permease [Rugosimonospora acidiphila]|uniref:Sugar ABC transporter permease n=1 Tax=Rugosimonospora acidiphila TaxID=556531 RepID=A0ABP9SDH1_9ACTN